MKILNHRRGFTLLELVLVLAILAVVTALATRALSHIEDQRRFETSQRGLEELEAAVLGSESERGADGTRIVSGFVADMGRLPQAVTLGSSDLTLGELWADPGPLFHFDLRPAVAANGVAEENEDVQVRVPGGWRGPYLQLPLGAGNLQDGWGNSYQSPAVPPAQDLALTSGYPRLRGIDDQPITEVGQSIGIVRHLGANGTFSGEDLAYDRDQDVVFFSPARHPDRLHAALKGTVQVFDGESLASADPTKMISVRVFAPNPANPAQIVVYKNDVPFDNNPVAFNIVPASLTIGPRVVRAYLVDPSSGTPATFPKSPVKTTLFRPGINTQDLRIDL